VSGEAYIVIVQGNNYPPIQWEFLDEDDAVVDLSGSKFWLKITWPRGEYVRGSGPGELVVDGPAGTVQWNYSVATSRLLPLGDGVAVYELERWDSVEGGVQQTLVRDKVICLKGENPDVPLVVNPLESAEGAF
jgi:hypothetical protein